MKRKERYCARLSEVVLTREGNYVTIAYKEPGVPSTRLEIGPELSEMSDEEIIELFNDMLRENARLAAGYKHVTVEVPLGSAQIKYFDRGDQWVPRGGVLRCLVEDNEHGQLVVGIDDQQLSLEEFGRMLTTYAGWGMRIEFVPEDELHRRPAHTVREPAEESAAEP